LRAVPCEKRAFDRVHSLLFRNEIVSPEEFGTFRCLELERTRKIWYVRHRDAVEGGECAVTEDAFGFEKGERSPVFLAEVLRERLYRFWF